MTPISSVKSGYGVDLGPAGTTSVRSLPDRPPHATDPSTARLSPFGKLQNALSTLVDSAEKLRDSGTWSATKALSSDPASVMAVSHQAPSASHDVVVQSLASAQVSTSSAVADPSAKLGIDTLHIAMGVWGPSQATFTNNPNWPRSSIVVGPHDDSLEHIRDKINAAGMGIVATVISDGTGSRLVLSATASGADHGFQVSSDPPSDALNLQHQPGTDATGTVNGVPVRSSTNTIKDAAAGVTLYFKQPTDSPVQVAVAPDTQAVKGAITDFARAYNELSAMDPGATAADVRPASSLARSLAESGLAIDARGTLQVNTQQLDARLSQAARQPASLRELAGQVNQMVDHLTSQTRLNSLDTEVSPYTAQMLNPYLRQEENSGN